MSEGRRRAAKAVRRPIRFAPVGTGVLLSATGCGEEGKFSWTRFVDVGGRLTGVEHCFLAWGDHDGDGDLCLAESAL